MKPRSRPQRARKRAPQRNRVSKNATRVSALLKDLGVAGLAAVMGADPRSIRRWNSGAAAPSGPAAALLAVLVTLNRAHVDVEALPARLALLVSDDFEVTRSVPFADMWAAWWEQHPDGVPEDAGS